jgi:hypothetical protein
MAKASKPNPNPNPDPDPDPEHLLRGRAMPLLRWTAQKKTHGGQVWQVMPP